MDIHRCRFVPYPPPPISAVAFSHISDPSKNAPPDLRLALARENGDLEIWNPLGGRWLQEQIFRRSTKRPVERIGWTQTIQLEEDGGSTFAKPDKLRLFSTDGSPAITEWNISYGTVGRYAESNFGDLWCFAAQPAYRLPKDGKVDGAVPAQLLAGGCGNGNIVLFSTENDDLRYLRLLAPAPGKKHKVLSITWRDRNTVVAGYEDSMIRIIDVNEKRVIRTMSLGKTSEGGKSIVWTLKCLPDGTILSGDSSGELKIWDARNFSCIQRLKTHQSDVQEIVSNAKGDLVFSVAVDRRTVAYKPVAPQQSKRSQRWTRLMHRRYHEHDIKCGAGYESKGMSLLVSGGVDASPVALPMHNWQTEYHRALSHLPQRPQMCASARSRLLLSWWNHEIHIYHVPRRTRDGTAVSDVGLEDRHDHEHLATLRLTGLEHITSAHISIDGNFIVASTTSGIRFFQLRLATANGRLILRTRQVQLPACLHNFGARHVGFSPDGRWLLVIRLDNTILLTKLSTSAQQRERPEIHDKIVKLRQIRQKQEARPLGEYSRNVSTFSFSPDSRVIVVGDLQGSIDAWILEGYEDPSWVDPDDSSANSRSNSGLDSDNDSDSDEDDDFFSPIIHGQKWIRSPSEMHFPRLDSAILELTFRPSPQAELHHSRTEETNIGLHPTRHTPHPVGHSSPPITINLIAITATHNLVELNILTGKLTDWSRRNPSSLLPADFTRIRDRLMGCYWDTSHDRQRLWMYGPRWIYMLDLRYDLPSPTAKNKISSHSNEAGEVSPTKKRKRSNSHSIRKSRGDRGTGAGGALKPENRATTGFGSLAVKYRGTGEEDAMDILDLDTHLEPPSDDDDAMGSTQLATLRRGMEDVIMTDEEAEMNGIAEDTENHDGMEHDGRTEGDVKPNGNTNNPRRLNHQPITRWGTTGHFRSIFGIAVLSSPSYPRNQKSADPLDDANKSHSYPDAELDTDPASTTGPNALEVIIIERPMHDVDLPPRFEGGQDWDS